MTQREHSDTIRHGGGLTLLELLMDCYAVAAGHLTLRMSNRLDCLAR